jgi:hypothetical protein
MIEISITKKTKKIIGIAMIIVGLSAFGISFNQGLIGQKHYSGLGCAVDARPPACITTNNQMTGGFIGMIPGFFIALFGASLILPTALRMVAKRIKGRVQT